MGQPNVALTTLSQNSGRDISCSHVLLGEGPCYVHTRGSYCRSVEFQMFPIGSGEYGGESWAWERTGCGT